MNIISKIWYYNGPRKHIEDPDKCGFTLSVSCGTQTSFIQTQGVCPDRDFDNRDDNKDNFDQLFNFDIWIQQEFR